MKENIIIVLFILSVPFLFTTKVLAHPGNTDSDGCHTQKSTGYYHCHNEPDDTSFSNSTGNYTGEYDDWKPYNATKESSSSSWWDTLFEWVCGAILLLIPISIISSWLYGIKRNEKVQPTHAEGGGMQIIRRDIESPVHKISPEKQKYLVGIQEISARMQEHFHFPEAYFALTNQTIEEMWVKQPHTLDELLDIKGLGEKKVEYFGREILELFGVNLPQKSEESVIKDPEVGSDNNKQPALDKMITSVLSKSKDPLKAREVANMLNKQYGLKLTRKQINHVLYTKLKNKVIQGDTYKWKLRV